MYPRTLGTSQKKCKWHMSPKNLKTSEIFSTLLGSISVYRTLLLFSTTLLIIFSMVLAVEWYKPLGVWGSLGLLLHLYCGIFLWILTKKFLWSARRRTEPTIFQPFATDLSGKCQSSNISFPKKIKEHLKSRGM